MKRFGDWWRIFFLVCIALPVGVPLFSIIYLAFGSEENIWPHLLSTVLPGYVYRTLLLAFGVGLLSLFLGIVTSWLVTMCEFPFRRFFEWGLLVPLAVPTYIIAYCYVDLFDYSGFLQRFIRWIFGYRLSSEYFFPEVRSLPGAIIVMSLVLYPYVYIVGRSGFLRLSGRYLDVGRVLGYSSWGCFFRIALPLCRPALAIGVALVMMECLNDIGAVEVLGIDTLTAGIYSTWLGRGNLGGGAQLALVMLLFSGSFLFLERLGRARREFYGSSGSDYRVSRFILGRFGGWCAFFVCLFPIFFGSLFPGIVLVRGSLSHLGDIFSTDYFLHVWNSIFLSFFAVLGVVFAGLFLSYMHRMAGSFYVSFFVRFSTLGYAVPGVIMGLGILVPFAYFDNVIDSQMRMWFGVSTGLIFSGTIFIMVLAYVGRFLTISFGTIESGFSRISPNLGYASRTLGRNWFSTLLEVYFPLLRPALISSSLLVFVDVMKELPMTLLLRPFGFETLATDVYTSASLDLIEEGSLSALTIVVTGLIPIILLNRAFGVGEERFSPFRWLRA